MKYQAAAVYTLAFIGLVCFILGLALNIVFTYIGLIALLLELLVIFVPWYLDIKRLQDKIESMEAEEAS